MSSNISLSKICITCNKVYIAKKTVTRFCSESCAKKAWKATYQEKKIESLKLPEYQKAIEINFNSIQVKEFLSIKEACLLLGISRMSLHRYIKKNLIKSIELEGKVIIHRGSIDNLIN